MSAQEIEEFQNRLQYRFKDSELLDLALSHRSWANEKGLDAHYERLEFLGDAVLGLLTSHWLYERDSEMAEGELSKLKSFVVSEPVLARWAGELELGGVLKLGIGEERSGGRQKSSLLSDALEAVIGAVFLDGGLDAARALVQPLVQKAVAEGSHGMPMADAKTRLQEMAQAVSLELPEYRHVAEAGPDHEKRFFVECWLAGRLLGSGTGASKKRAEQRAARAALGSFEAEVAEK